MNGKSNKEVFSKEFSTTNAALLKLLDSAHERDVLPSAAKLSHAVKSMPTKLPSTGLGLEVTNEHLLADLLPAVSSSSLSSRYFGFVTGGVTPAARLADYIVSTLDECLAVRIPAETVATDVENRALRMLAELLYLDTKSADGSDLWTGYFTPGSSTSNLYAVASGREYVLQKRGASNVASSGLLAACTAAHIQEVKVLNSMGHPSIVKAASLIGLGREAFQQVGCAGEPWKTDLNKLEEALKVANRACIVTVSCGEVNAGKFGTTAEKMQQIRALCDRYGAWLHADAGSFSFISLFAG